METKVTEFVEDLHRAAEKRKAYPVVTTHFITVNKLSLCVVNVEFKDLTVTLWNGNVYKKFESDGLYELDRELSDDQSNFIRRLKVVNGGWKS